MPTYKAPVNDTVFLLSDVFDYAKYANAPGFSDAPIDVVEAVLTEGAKFVEEVVQPLNRIGDLEGCTRHDDGSVTTPKGFKQAYKALVEGGWVGLAGDPAFGGQGLPHFLAVLFSEYENSANLAFSMYPGLTNGAVAAMMVHGSDDLKSRFLPKMTTGEWTGTMNLTEPQCGTDLGLIKTRAVPQGDGSYAITGQKIFISAGEHDLADNIVHLVLARIEGAPAGVKGISLFLVPKFLPDADGGPASATASSAARSSTRWAFTATPPQCSITTARKAGWSAKSIAGLPAMFVMMNGARLGVAVQGLPISEVAYQNAAAYAKDRRQGRSLKGAGRAGQARRPPARPSRRAAHAARNPRLQRGARARSWSGSRSPRTRRATRPTTKASQAAEDRLGLMTPVLKGVFTDLRLRQRGQGAAGAWRPRLYRRMGHGAVRARRPHRHDLRRRERRAGARPRRPQAAEGRRPRDHGLLWRNLAISRRQQRTMPRLRPILAACKPRSAICSRRACGCRATASPIPTMPAPRSTDYMHLFGLTALGYMWARIVKAVLARQARGESNPALDAKLTLAKFFNERMLPETGGASGAAQRRRRDADGAAGGSVLNREEDAGRSRRWRSRRRPA